MSRQDTKEIEQLRKEYDFKEVYDVTLATAFRPEDHDDLRYPFYDKIGKLIERLGKRPFLPHREIPSYWSIKKIIQVLHQIVIPTSDIMIAYLKGYNTNVSASLMMGFASGSKTPMSYMYQDIKELEGFKFQITTINLKTGETSTQVRDMAFSQDIYDLIEFKNDEEGLSKLEASLKAFYRKK